MSVDRDDETEAEMVDRRGREAHARYLEHLAAIEEHRRNGTLIDMGPAVPSGFIFDLRRGREWQT